MALEAPKRSPESEQRLLVIFALDQMGECSDMQLQQVFFEYDLMTYFDMMIALNELCAQGQVVREEKNKQSFYQLTDAGRETLSLFGTRILSSQMQMIRAHAEEWKQKFQIEKQYKSAIRPTQRQDFDVELRLMEQDTEIMKLTLNVPSYDIAQAFTRRWASCAGQIYADTFRLLSEGDK